MMEFGAMLCKPKKPACGICPVKTGCYAFINNATTTLPVKINKVKVRERFFNYLLITEGDKILMSKRDETDIWANMYDMPMIETSTLTADNELIILPGLANYFGENIRIIEISPVYKHILTHQRLYVRFITLKVNAVKLQKNWFFTDMESLQKLALPKIIFIFIKKKFNL
jgi:A/G-specific adenine glycosylase